MSEQDFDLSAERADTHAVIRVHGELDAYTAPRLRELAYDLIEQGSDVLVLDLTSLDFIDSTGLGVLVALKKRTRSSDASLCVAIRPDQANIRKVFEITGIHRVIPISDTVEAATTLCGVAASA